MESGCELSSEVAISESKSNIPALQEMINDIRESTASFAQNSNTSLLADDLRIKQAIALPSSSENDVPAEDTANNSTDTTSENLVGALISTGKRLSIALNNVASTTTTGELEESFSNTTPVESTPPVLQVDATPKKKQHIMISYNRSCEESCRRIRNKLKELKYKVWMDVYDMPNNFIDGMAKAIRNSYIVLLCINRKYNDSFWCRKEAEDTARKGIQLIPCFMEEQFPLEDWLDLIVGANVWIDFSKENKFDNSFEELIRKITCIEKELVTSPRETPPTTPVINNPLLPIIAVNPTAEESFNTIMQNFKTWVEENRHNLRRVNRTQSSQLITQLIHGLQSENNTVDDQIKSELLQQLLSSTTQEQNHLLSRLSQNLNPSDFPLMRSLFFIMALWAVRVVFQKNH